MNKQEWPIVRVFDNKGELRYAYEITDPSTGKVTHQFVEPEDDLLQQLQSALGNAPEQPKRHSIGEFEEMLQTEARRTNPQLNNPVALNNDDALLGSIAKVLGIENTTIHGAEYGGQY